MSLAASCAPRLTTAQNESPAPWVTIAIVSPRRWVSWTESLPVLACVVAWLPVDVDFVDAFWSGVPQAATKATAASATRIAGSRLMADVPSLSRSRAGQELDARPD